MRVFLDANILFSAALPHSRMRMFVGVLLDQGTCLTNVYAIEEAYRNLRLKASKAVPSLESLVKKCEIVSSLTTTIEITIASKDIPILGGAIAGQATHLLTGDERDFGKLWGTIVHGVKIVSPQLLAEELAKKKLL
ncbi:MAG TPA: hypothetical protein VJH55_01590 [Candidatus Paceibacterota bacterium]